MKAFDLCSEDDQILNGSFESPTALPNPGLCFGWCKKGKVSARGGASSPALPTSELARLNPPLYCAAWERCSVLSQNARAGEGRGQLWAALGHQSADGPRQQPRSGTSAWVLGVTCATNIDSDLCCCKSTDSDMALRDSIGLDITMTSDGSADLSYQPVLHIPSLSVSSSACLHSA